MRVRIRQLPHPHGRGLALMGLLLSVGACSRPMELDPLATATPAPIGTAEAGSLAMAAEYISPSPDPTRPASPSDTEPYVVRAGDTIGAIALEYNTTPDAIAQANGLADVAAISIDQMLHIPISDIREVGPATKLIPDSEAVYGPSSIGFNVDDFVSRTNGYLRNYREEVDGETLTGAQIVQLVAERYSVGPRVLLALLEYRSGWLTDPNPGGTALFYPAGHAREEWSGLHGQLMWAADHLNDGYYGWKTRGRHTIRLSDGSRVRIAPGLNAGTIGLQSLLAQDASGEEWRSDVGPDGLAATYRALFGDAFAQSTEPLVPLVLIQPHLELPWPAGQTWYFTGGPHGGWAPGSAWAALDFIPPDGGLSCYPSAEWATAMSDGLVLRSRDGEVLVDLDGDGQEQSGWTILYMHIAGEDRVPAGTQLATGDRIGHPSCEGGASSATHVHVARRYNGEWIAADGEHPFLIGGWTPVQTGSEYDGLLQQNGVAKEACECRDDALNGMTH